MNKNQDREKRMDIQNPTTGKFETYQLIMAENILNHVGIQLEYKDLIEAVTIPNSKYFILLKVPMKICLNSLIIGQINSYKLFCQKRLTDYVILTNPSDEMQNSSEFEDKIPLDIVDQKNMLKVFQTESRNIYQNYYDLVSSIWAYLRDYVKKNNNIQRDFNLLDDEDYTRNILEFEENLDRLKLIFLNLRNQIQDQARSLIQTLNEKSEFILEQADDEKEKLDLSFYHQLGLDN